MEIGQPVLKRHILTCWKHTFLGVSKLVVNHACNETSTSRWAPTFNSNVVQRIITEDHIQWAFNSMAPYKTPGQDGIYPVLLQRGVQY